jgi:hypothetical protein
MYFTAVPVLARQNFHGLTSRIGSMKADAELLRSNNLQSDPHDPKQINYKRPRERGGEKLRGLLKRQKTDTAVVTALSFLIMQWISLWKIFKTKNNRLLILPSPPLFFLFFSIKGEKHLHLMGSVQLEQKVTEAVQIILAQKLCLISDNHRRSAE